MAADVALHGYFPPGSTIRRVGRESVLMLGGGRALLMQVAHPLVAAGVHDYSDYAGDPWRRLARTMTALYTIVFGNRAEADAVTAQVRAVHERVRGQHGERRFSAFDPDLMMWVHATLVDTGLVMYETFVRRLRPEERESFYEEMKLVGRLFGTPEHVMPPTLDAFLEYERELLSGDVLEVGDTARELAEVVFSPPVPLLLRPGFEALGRVTAALLPEELRKRYGLRADPVNRLALAASARAARTLLPFLPRFLRSLEPPEGKRVASVPPLRLLTALAR